MRGDVLWTVVGRSDLEEVDEARDRANARHSSGAMIGDGNGVMSNMAASIGEDITEPGDTDPAVEYRRLRTLGILRGRLPADVLDLNRDSA